MKQPNIRIQIKPVHMPNKKALDHALWIDATLPYETYLEKLRAWSQTEAIEDMDYVIEKHAGFGKLSISAHEPLKSVHEKAQFIMRFDLKVANALHAQAKDKFEVAMRSYYGEFQSHTAFVEKATRNLIKLPTGFERFFDYEGLAAECLQIDSIYTIPAPNTASNIYVFWLPKS